jgi:hypothetical protein
MRTAVRTFIATMRRKFLIFSFITTSANAQQIYYTVSATEPLRSSCPSIEDVPSYNLAPYTYAQTETVRTALSVPKPTTTNTYGLPWQSVFQYFTNQSSTTWGNWDPSHPTSADDYTNKYGQSAYSSLWESTGLNITRGLLSTTVQPTPIPEKELILPPPLYFGPTSCYRFPKDFILGVAGSAAQVEGAVADEGRGPAYPDSIASILRSTGGEGTDDFTALENYYLYKQDVDRLAAIGMEYYSFSIAWSRILPFGFPGTPVNIQGLQHYDDLINYVISKGMTPIATLLHFDTPLPIFGNFTQALTERPYFSRANFGWSGPDFEDAFVNYGKIVLAHYADRVPIWITFNEPQAGATNGQAVYNVIHSHARLYHFYRQKLNGTGEFSMKMAATPGVPLDPRNSSHIQAVEERVNVLLRPLLDPLVWGQDYPEAYKQAIQDYVPLSRIDLEYMNGTLGKRNMRLKPTADSNIISRLRII